MNKVIKILILFFILQGCSFEPILVNKNFDFRFENINSSGDEKINEVIKNNLLSRTSGNKKYKINLNSEKNIQTVSIDKKKRYFGVSRVNFLFLIKHSINIISVFYKIVFFRSFIFFLLIYIIFPKVENLILLIVFFLLMNLTFLFFYLFNICRNNISNNIKNVKKIK